MNTQQSLDQIEAAVSLLGAARDMQRAAGDFLDKKIDELKHALGLPVTEQEPYRHRHTAPQPERKPDVNLAAEIREFTALSVAKRSRRTRKPRLRVVVDNSTSEVA